MTYITLKKQASFKPREQNNQDTSFDKISYNDKQNTESNQQQYENSKTLEGTNQFVNLLKKIENLNLNLMFLNN